MRNQPELPIYRVAGQPATQLLTVNVAFSGTQTVTVGTETYTYGTDFLGVSIQSQLQSLVATIRGDFQDSALTGTRTVVRDHTAYYMGNQLVVMATAPGTAGNSLATTTTNTGATWTAATMSGGTDPSFSITANGTLTVIQPTGTNLHTVVDSGSVTGSGNFTVAQATGTNLHAVVDSGVITPANATFSDPQLVTATTVTVAISLGQGAIIEQDGTVPFKFLLKTGVSAGTCTADNFTGSLSANTATGDGLGTKVALPKMVASTLSFYSASTIRAAVTLYS